MKKFILFSFAVLLLVSITITQARAQNAPPFWSLTGNDNASSGSKLGTTNAVPLRLVTNNITRMRIYDNGRVGIGNNITGVNTTRALNLADENAVMRILRVHPTFAPAIELLSRTTADGPNVAYWDMYTEPGDASFRIRDRNVPSGAGFNRLTISHATGYVGVGTNNPLSPLHVNNATANRTLSAVNTFNGTEDRVGVYGQSLNNPNWGIGVQGLGGYIGVRGEAANGGYAGVFGHGAIGVHGEGLIDAGGNSFGTGVYGYGATGLAGQGVVDSDIGVYGTGVSGNGFYGLYGIGVGDGNGAYGFGVGGTGFTGVFGGSGYQAGVGVEGYADGGGWGVDAYSTRSVGLVASTGNPDSSYAGVFNGSVYTSGLYAGSDRKLKQNVADMGGALALLNQLQPKTYEYRQDGDYKLMNLPKGKHYGLIAQDVEQVLPDLVKESRFDAAKANRRVILSTAFTQTNVVRAGKTVPVLPVPPTIRQQKENVLDFKAVNYTELIPIMVKAIQELSHENEGLKTEMAELKTLLANKNSNGSVTAAAPLLEQNTPNPARGTTTIRYRVPESASSAKITFANENGQVVKTINVNSRGLGLVNVGTAMLPAGVYTYSLWVEGKEMDGKKMVVAR